jgi:Zn finger protein HypA/HybF involved in hydrogenase expression
MNKGQVIKGKDIFTLVDKDMEIFECPKCKKQFQWDVAIDEIPDKCCPNCQYPQNSK